MPKENVNSVFRHELNIIQKGTADETDRKFKNSNYTNWNLRGTDVRKEIEEKMNLELLNYNVPKRENKYG